MRMQAERPDTQPRAGARRFGLGPRLFLFFALITLLALWANTITEDRTWREAERVAHAADLHAPLALVAAQLGTTLANYDAAVLARGRGANPAAVDAARTQLLAAVADYRREVGSRSVRLAPQVLEERIAQHIRASAGLEAGAVRRDNALGAYAGALAALARTIKDAGPEPAAVLAATTAYRQNPTATGAEDWQQAEARLRALAVPARPHVAPDSLAPLREAVLKLDSSFAHDRDHFSVQSRELLALVHVGIAEPARAGLSRATVATDDAHAAADHTRLIGALLVAGLALVLWLILARYIARPLQALRSASVRFAAGDLEARVRRGGSPELDELAVAFNRMADELSQARRHALEYSNRLETAVAERTKELERRADYDPVTGLPNRERLCAELEAQLALPDAPFALCLIDVEAPLPADAGREFVDAARLALAARLKAFAPERTFAAELGPEEFALLAPAGSLSEAAELAARLTAEFARPLLTQDVELATSAVVGVALAPLHGADAATLLAAADLALISAKRRGRNESCLYSAELALHAEGGRELVAALRQALEEGELELHYQPRIALPSLELDGVEALLRWRRGDGGFASPTELLAAAERAGLEAPLEACVLEAAIAQAGAWRSAGWAEARVAVNLSAREGLKRGLAARLEACLKKAALPAWALELELREEGLAATPESVAALAELRELGVGIALDNFGRDGASLTAIERLPLTRVKIDRRLTAEIDTNARSVALVQAIVRLCSALSLRIVAEGVERAAQLHALARCGALSVQGFYLARPMPATEFAAWRHAARPRLRILVEATGERADVLPLGTRRRAGRRTG
jgi:diguanylate cyclase (GGDEF)-like protein